MTAPRLPKTPSRALCWMSFVPHRDINLSCIHRTKVTLDREI